MSLIFFKKKKKEFELSSEYLHTKVRLKIYANRSMKELLADCNYITAGSEFDNWKLSDVKEDKEIDAYLMHYPGLRSVELIELMNKEGLRPATDRELLALGAQYPTLQTKYDVIELGTVGEFSDRRVLVLSGYRGKKKREIGHRYLTTSWYDRGGWGMVYSPELFLTVPK